MLLPPPLAQDEALRALADIRSVIDRSTRYSTFSALSGLVAGLAALAGSGLCGLFGGFVGACPAAGMPFVLVWLAVLVLTALAVTVLTRLKARRRNEVAWTPILRTALLAALGPAAAGIAGSGVLVCANRFELLPGLWLLLYGCCFWSVSFFAPLFMRALGVGFMLLGLVAWWLPSLAALWLGLGFGGLHLIFGAMVMRYHR